MEALEKDPNVLELVGTPAQAGWWLSTERHRRRIRVCKYTRTPASFPYKRTNAQTHTTHEHMHRTRNWHWLVCMLTYCGCIPLICARRSWQTCHCAAHEHMDLYLRHANTCTYTCIFSHCVQTCSTAVHLRTLHHTHTCSPHYLPLNNFRFSLLQLSFTLSGPKGKVEVMSQCFFRTQIETLMEKLLLKTADGRTITLYDVNIGGEKEEK